MKQVLQELGSGITAVAEVPEPAVARGALRIRTRRSLISAGTERMLVEFARSGWLGRAQKNPERVRQVLDKVRVDGLAATVEAVRSKLESALPLGYCNVGEVDEGVEISGYSAGDRVVSNGPHAEVVVVPVNLCARIPDTVTDDEAAFTVLGAIGLQGVRLAGPTLGESFVVTGLGLIGLITVQLLRANGCRVLGIDPNPERTALARRFGAATVELCNGEDVLAAADAFSRGRGVDGVLITASTQSDEPVAQAAKMCRKRGRIVLVGVAGLQLNRADFYEKELTFQVSCSYGPGRHDPDYEEGGHDYPFGFIRWTQQRNFEAILELMAAGQLEVKSLIARRFPIADATRAYDLLAGAQPPLGILLEYDRRNAGGAVRSVALRSAIEVTADAAAPAIGVIGAGNYAGRVLIPAFVRSGIGLVSIASRGGVTAARLGRKFGFAEATTDAAALIHDERLNAVVIATRHDTHASYVAQALVAGKHVFVEKPVAISASDVAQIEAALVACAGNQPILMVGFNRRFAPHIVRMKGLLQGTPGPKSFIVTVNAGAVPADHWTRDSGEGGGRLVGEGCHFVDLLRYLAGVPVAHWDVTQLGAPGGAAREDQATITLAFTDGSTGTIHYLANGHTGFPKERIEVFAAGRVLQLDNFRRMRGFGWKGFGSMNLWRQDKGQAACVAAFVSAVRDGRTSPIPLGEILEVARITVSLGEAARR